MSDHDQTADDTRKVCRVDGCEKPRKRGHALCSMHCARKWRHGDPEVVKQVHRAVRGVCLVEGCGQPDHGTHGYCDKHRSRMRRHGDPNALLRREYERFANGDIAYPTAHARVRDAYGPARQHLCCHCMQFAEDWAYDHNDPAELVSPEGRAYSTNTSHYVPLCRSCHRRFDAPYGRYGPAPDQRTERKPS